MAGPLRVTEFKEVMFSATTVRRGKGSQGGARSFGGLLVQLFEVEVTTPSGAQRVIDLPQPEEPITC